MSKRKLDSSTEARGFSIRSCIKDPRLKRVFFVGSESEGIESNGKGVSDVGIFEGGNDKDPITDAEIKHTSGDCEKEEKANNFNLIEKLDKVTNFAGGTNKTAYLPKGILKKPNGSRWNREDPNQSTPPENVITVDNGPANNCQNAFLKFTTKAAPCSKQKLVKVPGSLSYRRLLPYLMEMDRDEVQVSSDQSFTLNMDTPNPILSENHDSAEIPVSNTPNLEKPEHITAPTLVSAVPQSNEILTAENNQSNSTGFNVEPLNSSLNSILSENLDSAEIPVSNTPSLEKLQHITAPILVSTVARSREISTEENIQSNLTNFTVEPQPPLKDVTQAMEVLCSPPLVPSLPSVQGTLTIDELASGKQKMAEVSTSTKMGEIKSENPGVCKGTCMCLDCVLFRTQAERSFEFSKQQLNDADEIIRGLVTEICSLRLILEKSIRNRCSDCSHVYQDEIIKVVCEKASLAEKLATMRTKQMFMDSNAQCK